LEDANGNNVSSDIWHNVPVDVVINSSKASAGTYDQISNNIHFNNSDKTRFTITKEDDNLTDIYFRIDPNGNEVHKGAISEKIQDHIKIDQTKPKVTKISGYLVNTDGVSSLLNEITLGHFFQPGMEVKIEVEDPQPSVARQVVKVSGIKEVTYKIYGLNEQGAMASNQPIKEETTTPGTNNQVTFKINENGNYRICAVTTDHATNKSDEKCSDINIKKINVDVDDDGKPDFNDLNGDGCADTNIKWKDDSGKWQTLNGDVNGDGIPDYNIDSDGDGKPDINVDTDNDGRPDLNLVILKEWKPTQCITQNGEEYASGMTITPQINVDTDGDHIPDINIDTNGDMKADLNITENGSKIPYLNIMEPHSVWNPNKDYNYQNFAYDSIGEHRPILNIDTDKDGSPDVNVDIDGDGEPDINIDVNDDGIPDIKIDSDGDGIADINLDPDSDGKPTVNVMTITSWKPNKDNCKANNLTFDTMQITKNDTLKDQDIVIEAPNDHKFLPNYALKVTDCTKETSTAEKESFIEATNADTEIQKIWKLELSDGTHTIQPDGSIKVRIPIEDASKDAYVIVEKADGTLERIVPEIQGGYYVYETDYLGKVALLNKVNDDQQEEPKKDDSPREDNNDKISSNESQDSSVQGTYYQGNNTGGASTGDETNRLWYAGIGCSSLGVLFFLWFKRKHIEEA